MQTYGTLGDYQAIKGIDPTTLTDAERALIRQYLTRATRVVDGTTRRRFFPIQETRRYSIPSSYVDLRMRAFTRDDLMLDRDLLEAIRVQVTVNGAIVEMTEVVPLGGMDDIQTTLAFNAPGGLDSLGNVKVSVGDILQIEGELLPVLSINYGTKVAQVQRGAFDTIAVSHAAGVDIPKLRLITLVPGQDFLLIDFNIRPAIGLRIVWPATWAGLITGSSWRYRYPQIYVTGLWGYHEFKDEWWVNSLQTVPSSFTDATATISITDTTVTDANGVLAWQEGFLYRIDQELIWGGVITPGSGVTGTMAITRGENGSLAVAHASGRAIRRFDVLAEVVEATIDIARTLRESDESVGGRQGVSEMSVGVQISYAKDTAETLRRLVRSVI